MVAVLHARVSLAVILLILILLVLQFVAPGSEVRHVPWRVLVGLLDDADLDLGLEQRLLLLLPPHA